MREEAETCSVVRVLRCLEELKPREIENYFKDNHLRLLSESKLWEKAFNSISWNSSKQRFVHKFTKDHIILSIKNSISPNLTRSNNLFKMQELNPAYKSPDRKNSSAKNSAFMCFDARKNSENNSILEGCLKRESPLNDCSTKSHSQLTIRDPISVNFKVSEFNELSSFVGEDLRIKANLETFNNNYLSKKRTREIDANCTERIELKGSVKHSTDPTSIGLKDITRKVIELLKTCHTTTYKDLSKQILEQIPVESENESKNIRRRIYDAINVLKAINCLKQDNSKQISLNSHEFDEKYELQEEALNFKISRQLAFIKKKEEAKDNQLFSNCLIKKMIDSNRLNCFDEISTIKLNFPFLVAYSLSKDISSTTILSSEKRKKLFVSSDKPLMLKGDFDVLCMLNKISH